MRNVANNILLVSPWFQTVDGEPVGGVSNVIGNLSKKFYSKGLNISLLLPGDLDRIVPISDHQGVSIYSLYLRPVHDINHPIKGFLAFLVYLLPTVMRLRTFIKERGIEVINIHYLMQTHTYFLLLRWFLGVRIVISVHGSDVRKDPFDSIIIYFVTKIILYYANVIVAVSHKLKSDMVDFGLIRNAGRIIIIPNGVDLERKPDNQFISDNTVLLSKDYILLVASSLIKIKGVDILLRGFDIIRKKHPELYLYIVGEGPLKKDLVDLAANLKLTDCVCFLGSLSPKKVMALFGRAKLFVLPSRSEGLPIVLLEAFMNKIPVIASNVGGIPELVRDGETGYLFNSEDHLDLADKVNHLICNPSIAVKIAENGYKLILKRLNWDVVAEEYLKKAYFSSNRRRYGTF